MIGLSAAFASSGFIRVLYHVAFRRPGVAYIDRRVLLDVFLFLLLFLLVLFLMLLLFLLVLFLLMLFLFLLLLLLLRGKKLIAPLDPEKDPRKL